MTDAAVQPSPVQVCAEPGCGRTKPPHEFPAHGMCERSLRRLYRGRLGLPANPVLAELKAAFDRTAIFREARDEEKAKRRTTIRLAYAAGLSTYQIAEHVGLWFTTVHDMLDPAQRRPRGSVGKGRAASPEKVAEWAPALEQARDAVTEAEGKVAEADQQLLELLRQATDDSNPRRVGLRQVGEALGVSHVTVDEWLHTPDPEQEREQPERQPCRGRKPDGSACRLPARRGHRTCFHHRAQEGA